MSDQWYIYFVILVAGFFLLILFFVKKLKKGRGKPRTLRRFYSHIQKKKLFDFQNIATLLVPFLLSFVFLSLCFSEGVFYLDFKDDIFPFISLLPRTFLTPAALIAIAGPTILALNYRLFKGHTADLDKNRNTYSRIYKSPWRPYLDAQFDHSHQLSALIIAWGAFAYEIIADPLERLTKVANTI